MAGQCFGICEELGTLSGHICLIDQTDLIVICREFSMIGIVNSM